MKEEILEALSKPYVHTIKDINKATGIKRIDVEDILYDWKAKDIKIKIKKKRCYPNKRSRIWVYSC